MIKKIKELMQNEKIKELVRYVIIGAATTLVDYISYAVFFYLIHLEMNLSNTLSVVLAVIFAYITNKLFVFRSHANGVAALLKEMLSFFAARAGTMLFQIGALFLIHDVCGLDESWSMLTKAGISVVVLILNYIFSKLFVFKHK